MAASPLHIWPFETCCPGLCLQVLAAQLPAVLVISLTLAAGVGLDIEPCRAIGAVFAFLYVGTKLGELDWKR